MNAAWRARRFLAFLPFAALLLLKPALPEWAVIWPEQYALPFIEWINAAADFLRREEILGTLTFKDMTRAAASLIEWPLDFTYALTVKGFGKLAPPLPWTTAVGLAAVFGWWVGGWRIALLSGGCIFYFALFGKWKLSMITLSAVLVAAAVACAAGLALGIAAARWRRFERALLPALNIMQTLPHFSYLIPIAVFIGISHKAGVIATIMFAVPPMARLTLLGLRGVPGEVREAGKMAGCTPRQMLWKVDIPAARDSLMVGVNQVIMQCLAMVVIASFVGTKGLGQDLLFRLQSLRIGQALEIGAAIVFMAITMDRLSLGLAHKQPAHLASGPFWKKHPALTAAAAVVALTFTLAWLTPHAQKFPKSLVVTTAPFWDGLVNYITQNFFEALSFYRDGFLVNVLIPMRTMFQWVPWTAALALTAAAGWKLIGKRGAVLPCLLFLFIAFSGFWERAVITAYTVTFAALVCVFFGVPLGVWAASSPRKSRAAVFLCDTFQTFPSFIYLIPVIMLFRVGDVAVITAIVIYGIIPAVRYTVFGLNKVPPQTVEAGLMAGCNRFQLLWKVRLPLAFPEIMLGVHQTIMFSLFMAIIAAFIGTRDLGQEMFKAMAHSDIGKALVVGLCVSCMGLISDALISGWAEKRKKELGMN
ncbi:MAG: ABC transporter permease [Gammaproteobacteria bacterium]